MLIDLPSLLAPFPEEQFFEHFHNKTRFSIPVADRERAASLLPWRRINELLLNEMDEKRFFIARDNNHLPLPFYRSEKRQTIRPGKLDDLIAQGVSMVINDIRAIVPAIGLLADDIERRLGCRVSVNSYLSFGRKSAFLPHWDDHDVLVVQVHGCKRWRFAPGPVPYPVSFRRSDLIGHDWQWQEEMLLEAGDVLYVPRGEIHVAEVLDEPSVHLTIGLSPPRALNYLEHIRKLAEADPVLRMDLLRHLEPIAAAQHEAAIKYRLHELIDNCTFADFFREDDLKREPSVYLTLGKEELTENSRLVLGLRRRIDLPDCLPGSVPVTLHIAEDKHVLPASAIGILSWLFEHQQSSLAELNDALIPLHGKDAIVESLDLLLRRGLVVDLSSITGCNFDAL